MCSSEAVVKYKEDGTIDGDKSYITIIDQGGSWSTRVNDSGDETFIKGSIDLKLNFDTLFKYHYVPFTFAEFQGTDPIEETECTFSHQGETITADALKASTVTSNYGISDIYAMLCSRTGKEVILGVSRATYSYIEKGERSGTFEFWGNLQKVFNVPDAEMYPLMCLDEMEDDECVTSAKLQSN